VKTSLLAFVLALALVPRVSAGILDQSYEPASYGGAVIELTQTMAQTFQVGRSGLLEQVDLELARHQILAADPMTMELRTLRSDGAPSHSILVSHTILASELSTSLAWFSVDLHAANLHVNAGDRLAIVLHTASDYVAPGGGINPYAWRGELGSYTRGTTFMMRPGLDWTGPGWEDRDWLPLGLDMGFRTFVKPGQFTPVPEPSTLGFCAAGALLLIGTRIVRRRRVV
jgi:hypothetical protein